MRRPNATSKFNELSENHAKFWIISLLDRKIRDLVGGPQIWMIKIQDKIGKLEMSRTTTNLEMGRTKTCCTKVKLCIRLGEKFRQSYFGAVMTSSKSRKTSKNHKNRDFSEFSQL